MEKRQFDRRPKPLAKCLWTRLLQAHRVRMMLRKPSSHRSCAPLPPLKKWHRNKKCSSIIENKSLVRRATYRKEHRIIINPRGQCPYMSLAWLALPVPCWGNPRVNPHVTCRLYMAVHGDATRCPAQTNSQDAKPHSTRRDLLCRTRGARSCFVGSGNAMRIPAENRAGLNCSPMDSCMTGESL